MTREEVTLRLNRKDRGPWESQVGQAAGPCTGLGVGAVPGGSSDNQVPLQYYPTRELRRERSMELELRVRLSERPVPPGCGQREQLAQLHATASLCFPVRKGTGTYQPESLSLAHSPPSYS